jgi:hypothetical protein
MSNKLPKIISDKLIALFRDAISTSGSYKPEDNIVFFEESITESEYRFAWAFFAWLCENNKTFGRNLPDVYQDFYKEAGQKYIDSYWLKR